MEYIELVLIKKFLTVDSLIDINSIITGLNNITKGKVNAKPYGYEKMYMDKDLIKYKLYQLIDQLIERKINLRYFCSVLLNDMYPFYDGNGTTCNILRGVARI